jgi:hypothetical protein
MDLIQWFIVAAMLVAVCIVIIFAIYTYVQFQHPDDDTNQCIWFYRLTFITTFSFALFLVLSIPIDVASTPRLDSPALPFRMYWFWNILTVMVTSCLWILLPIAIIMYNSSNKKSLCAKVTNALLITSLLL